MIWNSQNFASPSITYCDSTDGLYRAWRQETASGKCRGRVVLGCYYTSQYEVMIPCCDPAEFETRVQAIFDMKPSRELLTGRPRWNEFVNGTKALDVNELRQNKVIGLRGVATWFANNVNGRFNQNCIKIHGFRDLKIQELYDYMTPELIAECTKFVGKPFKTTAEFTTFINAVNESLDGCIALAYNAFCDAKNGTCEKLQNTYIVYCEDWKKEFGICVSRWRNKYELDTKKVRESYKLKETDKFTIKELTKVPTQPLTDAQIAKNLDMFRKAIA